MVQPSRSEWVKALGWLLSLTAWAAPGLAQDHLPARPTQSQSKRQGLGSIPDRKMVVIENGVGIRTFAGSVGAAARPEPNRQVEIGDRPPRPPSHPRRAGNSP